MVKNLSTYSLTKEVRKCYLDTSKYQLQWLGEVEKGAVKKKTEKKLERSMVNSISLRFLQQVQACVKRMRKRPSCSFYKQVITVLELSELQ